MKAWRSRGIAPPILNLDSRWSLVFSFTPRPLYPGARSPLPLEQKAGSVLQCRSARAVGLFRKWRTAIVVLLPLFNSQTVAQKRLYSQPANVPKLQVARFLIQSIVLRYAHYTPRPLLPTANSVNYEQLTANNIQVMVLPILDLKFK